MDKLFLGRLAGEDPPLKSENEKKKQKWGFWTERGRKGQGLAP